MNEIFLYFGLFAASILGLILFATIIKMKEVQGTKTWQTTWGKITRSEIRSIQKRDLDDRESIRSVPSR